LHELKFDGYRIGAVIDHGRVQLFTRRRNDWTSEFPSVAAAASQLDVKTALIDGEVVVVGPDGRTDFYALQHAVGRGHPRLVYYVFDLLYLDGEDLRSQPLQQRKARLHSLVANAGSSLIRYSDHFAGDGAAFFDAARAAKAEGIVSKRADARYRAGRTRDWLKTKSVQRQELVIGGYLATAAAPLASVLTGYYDDSGTLIYAGKVGTGFQRFERELLNELRPAEITTCPFSVDVRPQGTDYRYAHWVRPTIVGDVEFLEWTPDGQLRHASFKAIRRDKLATEVRRELPEDGREAP
jgi:bifunctional non-homologous end joining protein LigD